MTPEDSTRLSLLRLGGEIDIDREFVAQEAGDEPMTEEERSEHERVRDERGAKFYADLLFVLTPAKYEPERARFLWNKITDHKRAMNAALHRNVGIAVAALDFLSNIQHEIDYAVLLDEDQIASVTELATKDAMTGLSDHSTFQLTLRRELRRAERYPKKVSLIMIDIDHFKLFNDAHGHPTGDQVLKRVARLMEEQVRQVDTACRYGGEEFAVVAPATDKQAAFGLAERLRTRIETDLAAEGVTVSLGVATFPVDGKETRSVIRAADEALYQSKASGRNCTTAAKLPT